MTKKIIVNTDGIGKRLDVFLSEVLEGKTRSYIKTLIEDGSILLNGETVKSGEKLCLNNEISIEEKEQKTLDLTPQDIFFETIYDCKDYIVINKPQGLVVHPSQSSKTGTLVNALLYSVKDLSSINGVVRPGIVHRLDKNTSGLMLVAKTDEAHLCLQKQIQTKQCKRKYMALLEGIVQKDEGRIETYIGRSKSDRKKMAVVGAMEGRKSVTLFRVLQRFERYSLCEFELETGRTHQIRVHAKHIGHTVVGDDVYGKADTKFGLKGQLLHSYYIKFKDVTSEKIMEFDIGLPNYFNEVLQKIK